VTETINSDCMTYQTSSLTLWHEITRDSNARSFKVIDSSDTQQSGTKVIIIDYLNMAEYHIKPDIGQGVI